MKGLLGGEAFLTVLGGIVDNDCRVAMVKRARQEQFPGGNLLPDLLGPDGLVANQGQ